MKIRISLTESKKAEESKPSAGLTKKEKSAVVKKAKAGKDIGKKGKGFEKVEKAAEKEYGSKKAGEKVAAAAMWKSQAKSKLKETLYPMIIQMIKENDGFGNSLEEDDMKPLVNTADEKNLANAIDKAPIVKDRLSKVSSPNEIDGALEVVIDSFGLKNVPKGVILTALKNALQKIAPEGGMVGTEE